jgi:glycosyltransferase involved in cell wall biosynthesis
VDVTYPGFAPPLPGVAQMKWLPDLQHVHLPHFFSAEELSARADWIAALARSRGILVLSSEAALADFLKLCPHPATTPQVWSFCTVLTEHETGGRNPRDAYGLPAKFAYLPNQFWAHKDHLTAFEALAKLRQRGLDLPLVCTGLEEDRRNPDHFARLMRYLSENGIDGAVRCLGLVPRNDQMEIFRHASVVIQPSLFEGWSTVVEDAKAVGRPIIATDLPVHREQLEGYDPAWLFRPSAAEELAALLERVWPQLSAGPEAERERMAGRHTERRRQDAARRFISIAQAAKALHDARRAGMARRADGQ